MLMLLKIKLQKFVLKQKNKVVQIRKKIRQIRITGTSAYSFFTKSKSKTAKKDWDSKIKFVLFSNFSGNAAIRYGLLNENKAIAAFEKKI